MHSAPGTVKKNGEGVVRMSGGEFRLFSEFIQGRCGIRMPPAKKVMLE